jgi:hypothetical protein
MRDTFDYDPTTTSMYDDQHIYGTAVGKPGSLKWKFAGGPYEEMMRAKEAKAASLAQY